MMLLCVPSDKTFALLWTLSCVCICPSVFHGALVESEDIIFVKSLYIYVDPGDQTQVIKFI